MGSSLTRSLPIPTTVEANTHTSADALAQGQPSGLRRRLAGVAFLGRTRNADRATRSGRRDEPTTRLDHYLSGSTTRVIHHRTVPGESREISHLIVGPAGVTVVDSRNYGDGRARVGRGALRVGRRTRSDLVEALLLRVEDVRGLLADTPYAEVRVEAALAYRQVEGLPTLHSFQAPRIMICGTRKIAREASRPGPLKTDRVNALASYLDEALDQG
jgi:hypothetical protein